MNILKNYGICVLSYIVCISILICILSLVFAYSSISDRYIETGIYIVVAVSAFISSLVLCKRIKKNGMIHGIVINALCIALLVVISSLLNHRFVFSNAILIYLGISVLSGIVGGILGVNI